MNIPNMLTLCRIILIPVFIGVYYIEATWVNKAVAARWVCEKLGIDVLDTMAVADSVGDRSILECVGHPVVMANSPPELLARFPSVGDVEDDGVIEALQAACRP